MDQTNGSPEAGLVQHFRCCSCVQRVLVGTLAALILLFSILYLVLATQSGIVYRDAFLRRGSEGEKVLYGGKLNGQSMIITVWPGQKQAEYQWGDKTYGPYTVVVDPTAVPRQDDMADLLTGVEVRKGNEVFFRGGYYQLSADIPLVIDENGDAQIVGGFWRESDPPVPDVGSILRIVLAPPLTHRGDSMCYWLGTFCAVLSIVSILYADALFRWNLRWRIRDVEHAEPSEWELFSRKLSWGVLSVLTLVAYLSGLGAQ